jgi:hypothetical protein
VNVLRVMQDAANEPSARDEVGSRASASENGLPQREPVLVLPPGQLPHRSRRRR